MLRIALSTKLPDVVAVAELCAASLNFVADLDLAHVAEEYDVN